MTWKRVLLAAAALLAAAGFMAWRSWWGPDPEAVLAKIPPRDTPVASPVEELASFRVAPGFRVELVAAEPLVVDPVSIDWDDAGRAFVVEMRGYMPDADGRGEDAPAGRVVVLEDEDADGRMDRSDVFLDGLVLPRAVAVLPQGVLVAEPPNLWLCEVEGDPPRCARKTRLSHYAVGRHDPEHLESALLPAIDGWIHNARSDRRFRLRGRELEEGAAVLRGQWGLAQDDEGRFFHNHNSAFLNADRVPSHYAMRQPATASRGDKPGIGTPLTADVEVYGVHPKPGLNRAYLRGVLRPDGRQRVATGVSGLVIQRGHQYGPGYRGDAFVPEVAGNLVAHFDLVRDGPSLEAVHRLYPDDEWGRREFLASDHERFRPVDVEVGPDGCVWVLDMYRGLVQHANYVSPHLRRYAESQGLVPPGRTGRIWRIVRDGEPIGYRPPPLHTDAQRLTALDHPNGWVRDRAQRGLVSRIEASVAEREVLASLRRFDDFGQLGRLHALWTLAAADALDAPTWRAALADDDPALRRAALRAGEALVRQGGAPARRAVLARLADDDAEVRLQALHSLGELPVQERPLDRLLEHGRLGGPLERQAVVSALAGLEGDALFSEIDRTRDGFDSASREAWLRELAIAEFLAAQSLADEGRIVQLLDLANGRLPEFQGVVLLEAIALGQARPGTSRIALAAPHSIFGDEPDPGTARGAAVAAARGHFTWPGDPRPGGARALTAEEEARRQTGEALFLASCAACHGPDGRGLPDLAPSLVRSPWVRDADDWIVRIVLQGLTGPVLVGGREWNRTMPPHAGDARFDDAGVAGLVTFLRRAWGHAEDPVDPGTVARIRAETAGRAVPWTVAELTDLPVRHRFDEFVGVYEVPIVGIELAVERQQTVLAFGRRQGGKTVLAELGDGRFWGEGVMVEFLHEEDRAVHGARVHYEGTPFDTSKQD